MSGRVRNMDLKLILLFFCCSANGALMESSHRLMARKVCRQIQDRAILFKIVGGRHVHASS